MSSQAGSATLIVVSTFTAITALPYEHLERATAGLRAELRQKLLHADVHQMPMWETFTVTGPREFTDPRGRRWFEYRATMRSRGPFDSATKVSPPGHVADGVRVRPRSCPAYVTVSPGRQIHCTHRAGHGPAEDMHQGLLRVTLPDGREHAASLVWSTSPVPGDEEHLRRSE